MLPTFRTSTEHIRYFLSGRRFYPDFSPAHVRNLQASPQSLEEFLEQYLAENSLDAVEQGELINLMKLLRRLEDNLVAAMRKKGVAVPPLPSMASIEAEAIKSALDFYRGNVTMAAKALGIGRNTLYRKMKEYGNRKG